MLEMMKSTVLVRLPLVSLLLVVACGGAAKPADSPPTDTSSLENGSPAPKDPASPSSTSALPADPRSPESTPPAGGVEAEPTGPSHPIPAATGLIDGKPFNPKLAHVVGKMQKDGRLVLRLDDSLDCTPSNDAALTLLVPWRDGYKVDLGSLMRTTKRGPGEFAFVRSAAARKKEFSKTFKPSGTVVIVKAPTAENAVGKMKIDLQSGGYMLAGELDILVCVAPK